MAEKEKDRELGGKVFEVAFGVEAKTPGYLIRDEIQREKLKGKAGRRAWFERRLVEGGESELARECWEEIRARFREGKTGGDWEREREGFFEERGMRIGEVERRREKEGMGRWKGRIRSCKERKDGRR